MGPLIPMGPKGPHGARGARGAHGAHGAHGGAPGAHEAHGWCRYDGIIPNLHTSSGGMMVFAALFINAIFVNFQPILLMHGASEETRCFELGIVGPRRADSERTVRGRRADGGWNRHVLYLLSYGPPRDLWANIYQIS